MKEINNGKLFVYTYKEGLLSPVAHDLKIELGDFSVQFNGADVQASFNLDSLSVIGAVQGGEVKPSALSRSDKAKIEKTIRREVLSVKRFPAATLDARVTGGTLSGELNLCGVKASIEGFVNSENGRASGHVVIQPTRWGIKPYTALFGALRLKDTVRIEFWVDLPL